MKRLLAYLLPVILFLAGCSTDDGARPAPVAPADGGMTFVVNLPDPNTGPASYTLTEADESVVSSVDVFAFEKSGDDFLLVEHVVGADIETDGTNTRKKKFHANFSKLEENGNYRFVVLANVKDLTENKTYTPGAEMSALLATFQLTNISKWTAASRDIPMWGTTEEIPVFANMNIDDLKLLRMVAKINVFVVGTAQTDFKLKSVRLYNYRKGGYVAPDARNLVNNSTEEVKAPTTLGAKVTGKTDPVVYSGNDLSDTQCVNQIYTFETEAEFNDDILNTETTHALVVGGYYKGKESYYRINFKKTDGTVTTYLDLLRNYRYEVNITQVKGSGYDNPGDAYNSKGINMDAEVIDWDSGGMSEITFDGQYVLTVSKGKWAFLKDAITASSTDNEVKIYTNAPGGWKVDKRVDGSGDAITWLSLGTTSGTQGTTVSSHILLLEPNLGVSSRTGYIYVSAGRLAYPIEVTQSNEGIVNVDEVKLKSTLTLTEGDEETLEAEVLPDNATNQRVVWSTSDPTVAFVEQDGKVIAIEPGTATITVTTQDGGKTAQCVVTVTAPVDGTEGTVTGRDGTTTYATVVYGGVKWMVQNSKEGTPSATGYQDGTSNVNGYYYTWQQAADACPSGWSLPNEDDWIALKGIVGSDENGNGKYWNNNDYGAFAGGGSIGGGWGGWGSYGYWWSSSASDQFYYSNGTMNGPDTSSSTYLFSVRCVKN